MYFLQKNYLGSITTLEIEFLLYAELFFHAKIHFVFIKINKFCRDNYALKIKTASKENYLRLEFRIRKYGTSISFHSQVKSFHILSKLHIFERIDWMLCHIPSFEQKVFVKSWRSRGKWFHTLYMCILMKARRNYKKLRSVVTKPHQRSLMRNGVSHFAPEFVLPIL